MFGAALRAEVDVNQRVGVIVCAQDNVAAAPAVAAVRSAFGYKFFTAETGGSIAAVAGRGVEQDRIYKAPCFHNKVFRCVLHK
jgi:hypothetical protein